jgi:hypothetical protein
MNKKREFEVVLQGLLGCACIFSLGHSLAHWFDPRSLRRTENNGITGSSIYEKEVDGDVVDDYSSRLNWWCFFLLADLPASEEGADA